MRKRVQTPKARVRAAHVVLAGNVQLGGALPKLAQTVLPVSGYVAVTEPLGDRLSEAITYRGAVSDTRLVDVHVGRLRKKLELAGVTEVSIETARGFGYRLIERQN